MPIVAQRAAPGPTVSESSANLTASKRSGCWGWGRGGEHLREGKAFTEDLHSPPGIASVHLGLRNNALSGLIVAPLGSKHTAGRKEDLGAGQHGLRGRKGKCDKVVLS